MLIEHADEALEHLPTGTGDLAQRDLGRELSAEVALLVGDRVGVDTVEELRQDLQFLCQAHLELPRGGLRSGLDAAQELLGDADLVAQLGERQVVEQAGQSQIAPDEPGVHRTASAAASPSSRRLGPICGLPTGTVGASG